MNNFNDLADFNNDEIYNLLDLANQLEKTPEPDALKGKVLSLLFLSPSLRTLASFQAGMSRMGGSSFVISPDMSIHGLETRHGIVMDGSAAEHIKEAVPVIASYGDIVGIRSFAERENLDDDLNDIKFKNLSSLVNKPLINMESAIQHPCQNLADWKTMDNLDIPKNGGKFVLSWAYHPNALPLAVPSSTLIMAAKRGMDVTILRPKGFELPKTIMEKAAAEAKKSGGSILESSNKNEAMEDADVIYAKSWSSTLNYGDKNKDKLLRENFIDWCVDESWFKTAKNECKFMHCLPVRRGVVVSDEVLDSPRSIIIQEAHNRMYAQMAVLYRMIKG